MRTKLRSKFSLLFIAFAAMLALPAVALADTVYNNIDATIDVAAENITLTEGGTNDTASVLITATNSDGKNGCNLTGSTALKVKAVSSDATKATASLVDPTNTSLAKDTFTSCGDSIKVKVAALAATGTTPVTISLEEVSNNTGATFTYDSAKFTVTVNSAKQNTSISNVSGSGAYGGNATLTAKLTSGTNNLSGKTVEFKLRNNAVCDNDTTTPLQACPTTDSNGVATLNNVSLSPVETGGVPIPVGGPTGTGYAGAVSASFAGDSGYNSSSGTGALTVSKADATIDVQGYTGAYDGNAHGATGTATGVNGEDLSGQLDFGDSFTNFPGGTANWSFAGNTNYNADSGSVEIVINKATATIDVQGYEGTYDGSAHGATGTATGVNDEDLSNLLDFGDSFTNFPGGTANWSFAGNTNYNEDSGSVEIVINKATATVQLSGLGPYIYDGTAKSATATTTPAGLSVQITYNSLTTAPTAVGSYNVLAKVTDNNYEGQATGTLVISAWTLKGFYAPVDYDTATTKVWNTVKGGSTVPLKFEIFKGSTESSNTADVDKFIATPVTCPNGSVTTDEIEILTTGGTALRYDTTAGQFIQNWQTPKKPGACYDVTMQTDDGTKLPVAHFQLK